jgi:hypothetical protein
MVGDVDDSNVDVELPTKCRVHVKDAPHNCSIKKDDGTTGLTVF